MSNPKGKFEGDLYVLLESSSREPRNPYRVQVYVWRTNRRGETGWFESYDGLKGYDDFGGFKFERHFKSPWRALDYYGKVMGERARRRARERVATHRTEGWGRIA